MDTSAGILDLPCVPDASEGTSFSCSLTLDEATDPGEDKSYNVVIESRDQAGNPTTAGKVVRFDFQGPVLENINSGSTTQYKIGDVIALSFSANESVNFSTLVCEGCNLPSSVDAALTPATGVAADDNPRGTSAALAREKTGSVEEDRAEEAPSSEPVGRHGTVSSPQCSQAAPVTDESRRTRAQACQ